MPLLDGQVDGNADNQSGQSGDGDVAAKAAADKAAADAAAANAGNPKWNDGVDESIRERMGKFKDINGLANSYVELEKKLGEGFKLPETDEEKAKFYARLGRPDDSDGYELGGDNDNDEVGFKPIAHQMGLSQEQAKGLSDWFGGLVEKQQSVGVEQGKNTEVALREKWGEKYGDNLELANRELVACFSESLIDQLGAGGFLDNQEFIGMLQRNGAAKANDTLGRTGDPLGPNVERTEAGQPYLEFPSMKEYEK